MSDATVPIVNFLLILSANVHSHSYILWATESQGGNFTGLCKFVFFKAQKNYDILLNVFNLKYKK